MYTKEEHKQLKIAFWEGFKKYQSKKRSSNGRKMNWLNYPSDIKFIFIRLEADTTGARLLFDIQHKDAGIRAIIWEQLQELRVVMEAEMGTDGIWNDRAFSASVSAFHRISWERTDLNFYHPEHCEAIYEFLGDRLECFDQFYQEYKDILIALAD